MVRRTVYGIVFFMAAFASAWAFDPPLGADTAGALASPFLLAGGFSAASLESPMADIVNPAASALLQRTTFDVNYLALIGLKAEKGWGHSANFGIGIPRPYGVWNAYAGLVSVPFTQAMPLGTVFTGRFGFSKDVYPNILIGLALNTQFGANGGFGWGLSGDIGVIGLAGDVGFLKDLTWGVSLRNFGKAFSAKGVTGIHGGPATSYASPFTAQVGVSTNFVRSESTGIKFGMNFDIWLPTFQNMVISTGLKLDWRDTVFFRMGWDFNLREAIAKQNQGLLPSFCIGASIPIGKKGEDPEKSRYSEIRPSLAAGQLTGDVWAFGLGMNVPIGVIDKKGPDISVSYPEKSHAAYYISPNNNGTRDELVLPLTIKDQRYVQSYTLKVMDERGNVIRTIANKEARPETQGFTGFFKRLGYVKKGVPVPSELVWDGRSDSGEMAPDGKYSIVIDAIDDNGNASATQPWPVVIDTAAPEIAVDKPVGDALIFSPDGDGSKDTFTIKQRGSAEDEWKAEIIDSSKNIVRTWSKKDSQPAEIVWDGKNNAGSMVPDGVYTYRIASVDRAGNTGSAEIGNILVNTEQPHIYVTIDRAAFSPNGDGVQDTVTFMPDVKVKKGLTSWEFAVLDQGDTAVWTKKGKADAFESKYVFNGKTEAGAVLPDGSYKVRLSLLYENGYKPEAFSPNFALDTKAPSADISIAAKAFNPLGGGAGTLAISQSGSSEDRWTGEMRDSAGRAVKTWTFIGKPDAKLLWDGSDDAGRTVPDGSYTYVLSATDKAGNTGVIKSSAVAVDTQNKAVRLALDRRAFSPNGDGIADSIVLFPESQSDTKIQSWSLVIASPQGTVAKKMTGASTLPQKLLWDGKTESGTAASDGSYYAELSVQYITSELEKARSVEFALDTRAPVIQISSEGTAFSPNDDGKRDTLLIRQKAEPGDTWEGRIINSKGKVERTWTWKDKVEDVSWDGRDNAGNKVPDGVYRYVVSAEDDAGNKAERSIGDISLDTRSTQVFVTASASGLSPNGDGIAETISFGLVVKLNDGVESWKLAIRDDAGKDRKIFSGKGKTIPQSILWDGKGDDGTINQGAYTAVFTVNYAKGDNAEGVSAGFVVDTEGPKVALSISPQYFSPDNDGIDDDLRINLAISDLSPIATWKFEITEESVVEGSGKKSERTFFTWTGKGKPAERLVWDGRSQNGELVEAATDYPYKFIISDELGNSTVKTGVISVDVLVIRDGNRLKIKVPSIVFRPNFADFKDLPPDIIARNERVLKRIAEILNKFKDYQIRVEGHANSVAKMSGAGQAEVQREETKELLPLSSARAEAVMNKLIEYGVTRQRLSVRGLGSSEPVVPFADALNRWKNRRVEFILLK